MPREEPQGATIRGGVRSPWSPIVSIRSGEDKAPAAGEYVSPFGPEERDAIMRLLRDGTYHRAAARIGEEDPELSDQ